MTETAAATLVAFERAIETVSKAPAPHDVEEVLRFMANLHRTSIPASPLDVVIAHLEGCGPNDPTLHKLALALQHWDHLEHSEWTEGTAAHSEPRRTRVLNELGFAPEHQRILNEKMPRFTEAEIATVIAESHDPWYDGARSEIQDFYWGAYLKQLRPPVGNWTASAAAALETSVEDVLQRLSDPTRPEIYPVKGLVMGYVQSGKTSHFSGLIAKAADAGYRLIIVLAGTLEILRAQTQRRLDKNIVGRELLDVAEYGADADWDDFLTHGGLPSAQGSFDWERLTNRSDDYRALRQHLHALQFQRLDQSKPFNHRDNLRRAAAKIAVVKKNTSVLKKFCDDLERLGELRTKLEAVPTLLIDDESDQASINTVRPDSSRERTRTNAAIARLLRLLPRAQYVGYTATPFANVFIDPTDADDLFPKDFIVSLPRPAGYMGVSDFYDFDSDEPMDQKGPNEAAHIRSVVGESSDAQNLPRAIDSFILSGAIKLFRVQQDPGKFAFRHHTMLVHHSARQWVHDQDRQVVDDIFQNGLRYSNPDHDEGLRTLFEEDFLPVSLDRAPGDPIPQTFSELKPFISACVSRVVAGNAVRVVNGAGRNRDDTPDFDEQPVWAILVGGTKLSRGYTVEGLTVSYYRRAAGAGDTLMQMGRWFGFRQGYQDLVRLFIGREETISGRTVDLYEAFGALCLDEEALREDLKKYSRSGLTPKRVPPLVSQHLSALRPTSRNKMFNAVIATMDFSGKWSEKTLAPSAARDVTANRAAASQLLSSCDPLEEVGISYRSGRSEKRFAALIGCTTSENILRFLESYTWAGGSAPMELESAFISREGEQGVMNEWLILAPMLQDSSRSVELDASLPPLSVFERSRVSEERFKVYSEPRHREAAAFMAGVEAVDEPSADLDRYALARPVLVIYFVREKGRPDSQIHVGFGVQYPGFPGPQGITWTVRDQENTSDVVVFHRD